MKMPIYLVAVLLILTGKAYAELRTHLPNGFHGAEGPSGQYLIIQVENNRITGLNGNILMLCENSDPIEEPTYDRYFTVVIDHFTSERRGRRTILNSAQRNDGHGTTGSFASIEIAIMSGLTARQVPNDRQGQIAIVSLNAGEGTQSCGATIEFRLTRGRVAQRWLSRDYGGIFASLMRLGNEVGYFTFGLPMNCTSSTGSFMDLVHVGGEWIRRPLRVDGTVNNYRLTDTAGGVGDYSIRLARDGTVEVGGTRTIGGYSCTGTMILNTVRR